MRYGILASLLLIPSLGHAAVLLSEVAWMGTTAGPNEEWIELYNHGSESAAVDGWTLSDNNALAITLSGTIAANSFVILERSDDDTVPGVSAFMTYTGALSNAGATLTLRDAAGTIVDQVVGGENWQNIGGDNVTKQTPQRGTTSWVTGAPTPGAANIVHEQPPSQDDEEEPVPAGAVRGVTTTQQKDGSSTRISLVPSTNELKIDIISPDISYVNQMVSFTAGANGVGETIRNSLKYTWNFGDTYTEDGRSVTHVYEYPGTYIVALNGTYARHDVTVYKSIQVLPVTLALSRTSAGDVVVKNDTDYDIDLSGYVLKGAKGVVFPKNTILGSKSTLTVSRERLEAPYALTPVVITDGRHEMVATESSRSTMLATASAVKLPPNLPAARTVETARAFTEPTVLGTSDKSRDEDEVTNAADEEGERIIPVYAKENGQNGGPSREDPLLVYIGLIVVLLASILFLYKRRVH